LYTYHCYWEFKEQFTVSVCVEEYVSEKARWYKNWPHGNAANSLYCVTVMT